MSITVLHLLVELLLAGLITGWRATFHTYKIFQLQDTYRSKQRRQTWSDFEPYCTLNVPIPLYLKKSVWEMSKANSLWFKTRSSALQMAPLPWRNLWSSPQREEAKNHQMTEDFILNCASKVRKFRSSSRVSQNQTYLFSIFTSPRIQTHCETVPPRHFTHCLRRFSADGTRRKSRAFEPEVSGAKNITFYHFPKTSS